MSEKFELTKDYTINRVINGCWQLSEGHSLKNSLDFQDVMRAFYMLTERGFTTFDCADIYTGAEEFIGSFVKELKDGRGISPSDIQIHTKYVPDLKILKEIDYKYTEKIIDRSLKRLNRDTLDLVQFHWWDYDIPGCIETAGDLCRLQEKGKIRNIGVTNFDTEHLKELVDAGIPVVSCQSQYSVFDRRPEKALLEYCKSENIALLCYGTLAGGFLAEKWIGKTSADPETRSQVKYLQVIEDSLGWDGYQELLLVLDQIAKRHGVSISHVASKYILDQEGVGAAIVGIRNSRHVVSNTKIFEFDLDKEEMEKIKNLIEQYQILDGEPFELERTVGSKYRNIMKMNLSEELSE
jgi:aryl-alcohol dehydrogenase-like predicted oxidoreductase